MKPVAAFRAATGFLFASAGAVLLAHARIATSGAFLPICSLFAAAPGLQWPPFRWRAARMAHRGFRPQGSAAYVSIQRRGAASVGEQTTVWSPAPVRAA